MKIKTITLGKEMKVGLPNYSNITASTYIVFEIGENELPDFDSAWNMVNQQVAQQVDGLDPSWIKTNEYKNFFKVTTKIPKRGVGK